MTYKDKYKSCEACPIQAICDFYWDEERICASLDNEEEQKAIDSEICQEIGVMHPYDCC